MDVVPDSCGMRALHKLFSEVSSEGGAPTVEHNRLRFVNRWEWVQLIVMIGISGYCNRLRLRFVNMRG